MRLFFIDQLIAWADIQVARFDADAEVRIQDRDLEKLRPGYLRLLVGILAFGALAVAFSLAEPPQLLTKRIDAVPHKYLADGLICIRQICRATKFPPRAIDRIGPAMPLPIEYKIDVQVDPDSTDLGLNQLLVPPIWGESEIYRNNVLLSQGQNVFDAFALENGVNRFRIVVKKASGQILGIRGLFPPTLLAPSNAFRFRDSVISEPATWHLIYGLQLMIVAILAMFWVWSKSQPELLFFLVLAFIDAVKTAFWLVINDGKVLISTAADSRVYEIFGSFSIFLTVPFILITFRAPLREMAELPKKHGWKYLGIVIVVSVALMSTLKNLSVSSARTLGFLAASTSFVLWISVSSLTPLLRKRLYSRFVLTSLTVLGVMIWYVRLAIDQFYLTTGITTEYNDQLLFFVVMTGLLAYQAGKTESRFSRVKALNSREVIHKVEREHVKGGRWGFIILVDIVGWTAMRWSIPTEQGRNEFSYCTLKALFEAFDNAVYSVPHQGGDSVFFAREGKPTREVYEDVLGRCRSLFQGRKTMREIGVTSLEVADKVLVARSTIYYGAYDIRITESECHHKESFAGDAPESCARIIGNDPDPKTVRIVADTDLDIFRPEGVEIKIAPGKGNVGEPEWRYWEA